MKDRLIPECLKAFSKRQRTVLFLLIAITVLLGLLFPILLSSDPRSVLTVSRSYRPGELSDEDVIAPADFSYVDEVATNDVVKRAAESILPQFSYSVSSSIAMRTRFNDFSQAYASGNLSSFFEANDMYLDSDAIARLKSLSGDSATMILSLVSDCISELVSDGICSEKSRKNTALSAFVRPYESMSLLSVISIVGLSRESE